VVVAASEAECSVECGVAKGWWWKAGEEEWSDRREDIAAGRGGGRRRRGDREVETKRGGGFGRAGGDVGSGLGDGDLSAGEPTQTFPVTGLPRPGGVTTPRDIPCALRWYPCLLAALAVQLCREQPAHALAFHPEVTAAVLRTTV
jgi:hypothetical protein